MLSFIFFHSLIKTFVAGNEKEKTNETISWYIVKWNPVLSNDNSCHVPNLSFPLPCSLHSNLLTLSRGYTQTTARELHGPNQDLHRQATVLKLSLFVGLLQWDLYPVHGQAFYKLIPCGGMPSSTLMLQVKRCSASMEYARSS